METKGNSRSLGRWSLLLLLLGLVIPLATGQALSYKEAVLCAVDGLNQRDGKHGLEPGLPTFSFDQDEDPDTPKPVSFTVKETVCPRTTQQPLEECDFKENGLVKQCVGTVVLDPAKDYFDISCDKVSDPFWVATPGGEVLRGTSYVPITHCPIQGRESPSYPGLLPQPEPQVSGLTLKFLRVAVLKMWSSPGRLSEWQILSPHQTY
uniref:Uncharacterized protein n=1 Tax=Equus asinus TaxID=9793 RepID=A0A8C4PKX8_EQUAS